MLFLNRRVLQNFNRLRSLKLNARKLLKNSTIFAPSLNSSAEWDCKLKNGALIEKGTILGELKTNNEKIPIFAEESGKIVKIFTKNVNVESGDKLIEIETGNYLSYNNKTKIVKVGNFPESITSGDLKIIKRIGDFVKENETVAEVETDKTTMEINSPFNGTIKEFLVADGQKVEQGSSICKIEQSNEDLTQIEQNSGHQVKIEEKIMKKEEHLEEVSQNSTDNVKMYKFVEKDIEIDQSEIFDPSIAGEESHFARSQIRTKMSKIRAKIAERLKGSQQTNVMLTTFNEIDMTQLLNFRKEINDSLIKSNKKIGLMPFFVLAASKALLKFPIINSFIDGKEIVENNFVDISIAVASQKGLVVPVLRDTQHMRLLGIEKKIYEFQQRANAGKLEISEMTGGTFTISNGGVFGSLMSTPIINPPQSAILGLHATQSRPVVIDDKIEIRKMMYVALTYDHRLIDGRDSILFLKEVKANIEDPVTLAVD